MSQVWANLLLSHVKKKYWEDIKKLWKLMNIHLQKEESWLNFFHHNGFSVGCAIKLNNVLFAVPNGVQQNLMAAIQDNVTDETIILSDCWKGHPKSKMLFINISLLTPN